MKRFILPLLLAPAVAGAQIHYTMSTQPSTQTVAVTITTDNKADKIAYFMPAWVPGFYVLLPEHAKNVIDVKARDSAGRALRIEPQTNFHEWIVDDPKHGKVIFSYTVKGVDPGLGFFGVNVRKDTAYVLGGAAFMYVENRKSEPTTLRITNPAGWDIGTSMSKDANGVYTGRDYDEFIDHPIDLGHFVKRTFTAEGHPFEIDFVTLGEPFADAQADAYTARIKQLVVPAMQMFGKSPFNRYVFHLHFAVGNFSGGLEHQASVTIALPPRTGPAAVDDLFTHEFFHAWNAKNIRPAVLGPFDYTKEDRTDNLWFAEGVTDYYAKVNAYRSGLDDMDDYLFPAFSTEIRTYQGGRTRLTHTLAEASRGAWEGFSEGMGDLSYYNKGQLAGWIIDAEIRKATNGQKSLDDVMRYMYSEYHLPDKPGYPENGILLACNKISGTDMTALYNKLIYSTDDLPYQDLEHIGIRVTAKGEQYPSLGFTTDDAGVIQDLNPAIQRQGLQTGDKVVSVGGKPYSHFLYGLSTTGFDLAIRRGGEPMTLHLDPVMVTAERYQAAADPFCTDEQGKRLEQWLQRPSGIK
jgi:predicted metalloprotease with PDZ domain